MSNPPPPTPTDEGHCLCSSVRFTLSGPPLYNVICHCTNCRRHGGSIFHCASIYLVSQYTLHTDPTFMTIYTDEATQSGKPLYRAFCRVCGSKVSARTPWNEEIISIPAGVLESANEATESTSAWRPHKEQFCDDRQGWVPEFGGLISQGRFGKGPGGKEVEDVSKGQ